MRPIFHFAVLARGGLWVLLGMLLGALMPAESACTRVLTAPVAPTSLNVIVANDLVSGALVEFLRKVAQRSGCDLQFHSLPRPRLDRMFFSDKADILFPASRTSTRDRQAEFVPWFQLQPYLITVKWNTETVADLRELMSRHDWHAAVVKNYSWGDTYDTVLQQLDRLGRVTYVADLKAVHAMLRAGHARFTLLPPSLLYSSVNSSHYPVGLPADFTFQLLADLPSTTVGMYVNPRRVAPADIDALRAASRQAAREGLLMRSLAGYYPHEILALDTKALP